MFTNIHAAADFVSHTQCKILILSHLTITMRAERLEDSIPSACRAQQYQSVWHLSQWPWSSEIQSLRSLF